MYINIKYIRYNKHSCSSMMSSLSTRSYNITGVFSIPTFLLWIPPFSFAASPQLKRILLCAVRAVTQLDMRSNYNAAHLVTQIERARGNCWCNWAPLPSPPVLIAHEIVSLSLTSDCSDILLSSACMWLRRKMKKSSSGLLTLRLPNPFHPQLCPSQSFFGRCSAVPYVINRRHSSSLQMCSSWCTVHRTPRGSPRHFIIHLTPHLLFFFLFFFPV